jgi:MFS family permease
MSNLDNDSRASGADRARDVGSVAATPVGDGATTRETVVRREKERFGGMKFGSAFFGWLTATGTAIILTALVASTGTAIGLGNGATAGDVADAASSNADTVGLIGGILVAVILLIAYYCGGYVAGRMARFDGVKQGVAVWLWAIIIAIVLAVVGLIAGSQFDILASLDSFPRIPLNEGAITAGSIVTVVIALVVSLLGAILGGLAGMRFHRRVDKAGLGR